MLIVKQCQSDHRYTAWLQTWLEALPNALKSDVVHEMFWQSFRRDRPNMITLLKALIDQPLNLWGVSSTIDGEPAMLDQWCKKVLLMQLLPENDDSAFERGLFVEQWESLITVVRDWKTPVPTIVWWVMDISSKPLLQHDGLTEEEKKAWVMRTNWNTMVFENNLMRNYMPQWIPAMKAWGQERYALYEQQLLQEATDQHRSGKPNVRSSPPRM